MKIRHIVVMQITENIASASTPSVSFSLTENAAQRINTLKNKDSRDNFRFRILVKGGGCSGFQYEFALDASDLAPEDSVFSLNGAEVVIDDISLGLVAGSQLDFVEDLSSAGFEIKNPKATAKCGCGNSFSVAL